MLIDFFKAQEKARRASRWLVFWMSLCVIGVILVFYGIAFIFKLLLTIKRSVGMPSLELLDLPLLGQVTLVVGGIIVTGSLIKRAQLRRRVDALAYDLGGREIDPATKDFHERRLINVVEEMAIAAGVPAPSIWILDEEKSINTFAAGSDPANAIIGVTRGALEQLNREEWQGVIAHEFSHLLNGDTRLSMDLAGGVYGLLMVSMLGRKLLRFSTSEWSWYFSFEAFLAILGAIIWLIGSVSAFFANVLQAAFCARRECLADATAVQLTRQSSGLVNALRKIGGSWRQGLILNPAAAEARHLFLVPCENQRFWFSTHPALEKRIKSLDSTWDGSMLKKNATPHPTGVPVESDSDASPSICMREQAQALIHGVLLSPESPWHERGKEFIAAQHGAEMAEHASQWSLSLQHQAAEEKLIWVDRSLPWLRKLDRAEVEQLMATNRALCEMDQEIDLFEFMLEQVIARHVAIGAGVRPVAAMRYRELEAVEHEIAILIGIFSSLGGGGASTIAAQEEYRQHTGRELPLLNGDACSLEATAEALKQLDAATPLVKSRVLRLCSLVVQADGVIESNELLLLRAVADALGSPMPRTSLV